MYQFQGFMAILFGLTSLLMFYYVGKVEERVAWLEYRNKRLMEKIAALEKKNGSIDDENVRVYKKIID